MGSMQSDSSGFGDTEGSGENTAPENNFLLKVVFFILVFTLVFLFHIFYIFIYIFFSTNALIHVLFFSITYILHLVISNER